MVSAPPRSASRLLIHEPALQVLPSLVKVVGLNEAIILQQIQYWLTGPYHHQFDGRRWHYNPLTKWAEDFPWWSESTIWRAMKHLEDLGVLLIGEYHEDRRDRTKWYSIDYDRLDDLKNASGQFDEMHSPKNDEMHLVKLTSSTLDQDSPAQTHVPAPPQPPPSHFILEDGDEIPAHHPGPRTRAPQRLTGLAKWSQ